MESYPVDGVVENGAGGDEELREQLRVHTFLLVFLEVHPGFLEEFYGMGGEGVAADVELPEVELPDDGAAGVGGGGEAARSVEEGEAELEEVEAVDVGADVLVVGVGELLEGPGVVDDDAGELGVHGDEREVVDDVSDHVDLRFEVSGPHIADLDVAVLHFLFRHLAPGIGSATELGRGRSI